MRKKSGTIGHRRKEYGQDSFIITDDRVVRRTSIISAALKSAQTSALSSKSPNVTSASVTPADEKLFYKAIHRDPDSHRYVIEKKLMAGGMGAVYYVFDRDFQRETAMKVILPALHDQSAAIDNFIREARITAQLEHPNVIPVHDLGFLPDHGIFFTMKLMYGESLGRILQRIESGDANAVRRYDAFSLLGAFRKVCDAVAFAHSRGVLHRDIKPQNIMVGEYGEVLLMDWGLAKHIGAGKSPVAGGRKPRAGKSTRSSTDTTQIGVVKGSPAYMSPEQAYGDMQALDQRSDIFLLGATLYQIVTFFPPYLGDDVYAVLENARRHNITIPDQSDAWTPLLPDDLWRIIKKAMANHKEDRYQTVNELSEDIDALLCGDIDFRRRIYGPGDLLMVEGEAGAESFIIVEGAVRVFKRVNNEEVTISVLGKGDIVGEMALITLESRSASVIAEERTEVMVLSQQLFTQHLTKLPSWLGKTIYLLAERLNEANTRRLNRRELSEDSPLRN